MLKEIPNFPTYFINEEANVFSVKNYKNRKDGTPKILMLSKHKRRGYTCVHLRKNGKLITVNLCVLMLSTFVCERPSGAVACHGTLGKEVDLLSNLSWGTSKQNSLDRFRDGTMLIGQNAPSARLNELQVRIIKKAYSKRLCSFNYLANTFHVRKGTIVHIIKGHTWTHV